MKELVVGAVGYPSDTLYARDLIAWVAVGLASLHPRVEDALARKVWRLSPPHALEAHRIGPAWYGACAAAAVDPDKRRVSVHGPSPGKSVRPAQAHIDWRVDRGSTDLTSSHDEPEPGAA